MTPGKQMQAAAVDDLAGRGARQIAEGGKAAGADAEIAHALAVVVDDGAALEDQVEGLGHLSRHPEQAGLELRAPSAYVSARVLARD